jgi:hypothetical protein
VVRIREIRVAASQEEHIWVKHQVTPEEVDEVCFGNPWVLGGRDGSYAVYGRTGAGRLLVAFIYPRGGGLFALATARDMNLTERRRYLQQRS